MIKVITFDLDDTLWDVTPVLMRAEARLFEWLQRHCPRPIETFSLKSMRAMRMELLKTRPDLAHRITEARRHILQTAMERSGVASQEAEQLSRQAMEVFLEARHEVELFDDVEEVIVELHNRYLLGVLTNGNADIYRLPLGRYFTFAYSAEALNSSKPLPLHFERTLEKTGAKPREIIHVGDHMEHDIVAAQAMGWHTIWINSAGEDDHAGAQPSETVRRVAEIPAAVRRIESALAQGAINKDQDDC